MRRVFVLIALLLSLALIVGSKLFNREFYQALILKGRCVWKMLWFTPNLRSFTIRRVTRSVQCSWPRIARLKPKLFTGKTCAAIVKTAGLYMG